MTVERVHSRYGVELHVDGMGGAVVLGGITEQNVRTASDVRAQPTSGEIYPRHVGLYAQKPIATFGTLQLARALDNIGLLGLAIASTVNPGVNFYAQKWAEGSTPAAGASHRKYTLREGLIVPRRISVSHQQDAQLDYEALVTYDGTNDPLVIADNQALPSGMLDDQRYSLGPFTIGGIVTGQAVNLEIEFGADARTQGADSDVWDTHSLVRAVTPTIRLRGTDLEWFKGANIPLLGQAATHANTTLVLRKRADKSTFVANTTAEHISLTADGLAVIDTAMDERGSDPAEIELMLTTKFDGTNVPLVIDTTATY